MGKRITKAKKTAKKKIIKASEVYVENRGRPGEYKPEYAEIALRMGYLGTKNEDLARFFEVGLGTFERWMREHEDFRRAVRAGREEADAKVAESLFKRATGYSHDSVKIMTRAIGDGESVIEQVPFVQHYPPDSNSMFFWLKNRRPDLWRERSDNDTNLHIMGVLNLSAAGDQRRSKPTAREVEHHYFTAVKDITNLVEIEIKGR